MGSEVNCLGTALISCCMDPVTGFYRTGSCQVGPDDAGVHAVCIEATEDFLVFSKAAGNNLSTPNLMFGFSGLKPGDRWCLCASRWQEAFLAGCAPLVILASTHERALDFCFLGDLKRHALDADLNALMDDLLSNKGSGASQNE